MIRGLLRRVNDQKEEIELVKAELEQLLKCVDNKEQLLKHFESDREKLMKKNRSLLKMVVVSWVLFIMFVTIILM